MSGGIDESIPKNVFDPSSAANLTASGILVLAIVCAGSSAYAMGKYRNEKARFEYQMAMWTVVSAVAIFAGGLYIAWAFD